MNFIYLGIIAFLMLIGMSATYFLRAAVANISAERRHAGINAPSLGAFGWAIIILWPITITCILISCAYDIARGR
jgi:hypothetical protein